MAVRELSGDEIRAINQLRDALNTAAALLNSLRKGSVLIEYGIGPNKAGDQELLTFNVYSPVDLKKLSS